MCAVVLARGSTPVDVCDMRDVEIVRPLASTHNCFISIVRIGGAGSSASAPSNLGVAKSYKKAKLSEDELKQVELEIKLLVHLQDNKAVVPFWLALEDSTQLHIITAWCEGDLRAKMAAGRLPEVTVRDHIVLPLLGLLAEMHSKNWVHRDLKPENVFVSGNHVMLGDYGLAIAMPTSTDSSSNGDSSSSPKATNSSSISPVPRARTSSSGGSKRAALMRASASSSSISELEASNRCSSSAGHAMKRSSSFGSVHPFDCSVLPQLPHLHAGGTPAYSAPEVVLAAFNNTPVAQAVGPQNDIWSLGVLVWECLTSQHPFGDPGMSAGSFMCSIISDKELAFNQLPVSEPCKHWLAQALCKDPSKRATAVQLLQHDWLAADLPVTDPLQQLALTQQQRQQGQGLLAAAQGQAMQQLHAMQQRQLSCPEPLMHGCTSEDWRVPSGLAAALSGREADTTAAASVWEVRSCLNGIPEARQQHSNSFTARQGSNGRTQQHNSPWNAAGAAPAAAPAAAAAAAAGGGMSRSAGMGVCLEPNSGKSFCGQQHRAASPFAYLDSISSWED